MAEKQVKQEVCLPFETEQLCLTTTRSMSATEGPLLVSQGFGSTRRGLPPVPLQIDCLRLHAANSQQSASPLPTSLFSPGAPSPSAFPAPPLAAPKSRSEVDVMDDSSAAEERIWSWLDKQKKRSVSVPSSLKLGKKASEAKLAKRKSASSVQSSTASAESGETAWETADEDIAWEDAEESIADEALKEPSEDMSKAAVSVSEPLSTPLTPESTNYRSSRTFDSVRSPWSTHSRRVTHSSAVTTPRSSWDVTTATKLAVEHIERGSLKSPVQIKRSGSGKSSKSGPAGRSSGGSRRSGRDSPPSRVVPLSFRRTRLKRRSLPLSGHLRQTSEAYISRSQSAEPMKQGDEDDESEVLLDQEEATFDWAPRPLILHPQRMLASSPSSSPLAAATVKTGDISRNPSSRSQHSSPLHTLPETAENSPVTPSSSLNTLDKLTNALEADAPVLESPSPEAEVETSPKRVRIDVAIQTDEPLLKPPTPMRPLALSRTMSSDSAMSAGSGRSSVGPASAGSLSRPVSADSNQGNRWSNSTAKAERLRSFSKRLSGSPKPAQQLALQLTNLPSSAADLGMSLSPASVASFGSGTLGLRSSKRTSLDLSAASSRRHSLDLTQQSRRGSASSVHGMPETTEPLRIRRASLDTTRETEEEPQAFPPPLPNKSFEEVLRSHGTKKLYARSPIGESTASATADLIGLLKRAESPKLTKASCLGAEAFDESLSPRSGKSSSPAILEEPRKVIARTPSPMMSDTKSRVRGFFGLTRTTSSPSTKRVSRPILQPQSISADLLARATIAAGPHAVHPKPEEMPVFHTTRWNGKAIKKKSSHAIESSLPSPSVPSYESLSTDIEIAHIPASLIAELFRGPVIMSTPEPIADLGGVPGARKRAASPPATGTTRSSTKNHQRDHSRGQRAPPPPAVPRISRKVQETERPGGFLVLPQRITSRSNASSTDKSYL